MREFKHTIAAENGLHARPAGSLANQAKQFKSTIKLSARGKEADAKRLLSIMSLGATRGTELHFIIEGEDENEAEKSLSDFCHEHL
ncbi:MAG: HPr family phosphocarrier protein [Clostridia bacterium]|nr:HPr family phosphocarrier protein [Clostridia bacterium]